MGIPNVSEVSILQKLLNQAITLRLYANNIVPAEGDTAATYTEVTGGGYALKNLVYASWTIVAGDPSNATYAPQDFNFTGATAGTGIIYGYYLLDVGNILIGSERFSVSITPANLTLIRITPKIQTS